MTNEKKKEIAKLRIETEAGMRLDSFLASSFCDKSRSYIKKLIDEKKVLVNGDFKKAGYEVREGDEIAIEFPETSSLNVAPENIPLDILYEDSDVLIVNKPRGMVVHPANGHSDQTLVNALLYHCRDLSGINGILRPGIVHRIDKDTTGLLIVCKNDFAHRKIAEALKEHSTTRRYRAIVKGNMKEESGRINLPLARDPKDRKKFCVSEKGKEAITDFQVIEHLKGFTYMEFSLRTGRTHQIRVHMSHMGHPVLGDPLYGGEDARFKTNGQLLHAMTIGFIHPTKKNYMEFSKEPPEDFQKILNALRN